MKSFSRMLAAAGEKQNYRHVTSSDEEDSMASEDQGFLNDTQSRPINRRTTVTDTVKSVLVLLLLASSTVLVIITAAKQAFPALSNYNFPASAIDPNMIDLNPPSEVLVQPCGTSPEEAQARGCFFDNIPFAWVHPRCYDEDLSKSFRDLKFQFSLSWNNTEPVNQDEAYKGFHPSLYVNWEYHVTHCTWMWMKMHRAILGKGRSVLDGVAKDYQHTSHCETMLLRRQDVPYDAMNTVVSIKYPDCGA